MEKHLHKYQGSTTKQLEGGAPRLDFSLAVLEDALVAAKGCWWAVNYGAA